MTAARRIGFATCAPWPEIARGDRPVAAALESQGFEVVAVPWNGVGEHAPPPLESLDLLVHRSDWDHHHHAADFRAWCASVEQAGVPMQNSWALLDWGLDKRGLLDLAAHDLPIPRTTDVASADQLADWMDRHALERVVVKPAWGASGHGVELVEGSAVGEGFSRARQAAAGRVLLAQEFLSGVVSGEVSTVFVAGEASHAFRKLPADGDFRVNSGHGGHSQAEAVDAQLADLGGRVMGVLPDRPLYLRLDTVMSTAGPVILEVEVVEPALGYDLVPDAAPRLADAIAAVCG